MRVPRDIAAILWAAVFVNAVVGVSQGQTEVKVVSPNPAKDMEGDFQSPGGGQARFQMLFPTSDFATLPDSYNTIVGLAWRPDGGARLSEPVSGPGMLRLSTTNVDHLSSIFGDNLGPDATLVFDDIVTWQTDNQPPGGPRDFDYSIDFQTPFTFDPAQGNLLLEFVATSNWDHTSGWAIDSHFRDTENRTVVGSGDPFAEVAATPPSNPPPTFSFVTQFTFIEPRLQAGDADMDGDFNQLDLVVVQQGAKYLTGEAATWGEGDWDGAPGGSLSQHVPPAGNGLFDTLDIVAALSNGLYLQGPYAAVASELVADTAINDLAHDDPLLSRSEIDFANVVSIPEPISAWLLVISCLTALANYRVVRRRLRPRTWLRSCSSRRMRKHLTLEAFEVRCYLTSVVFTEHEITSSDASQPESVFAADIDGDGDMDVLSASQLDERISWFPNIDGEGTFGRPWMITDDLPYASWVQAADLDGDGDLDVVAASNDEIVSFENTNGRGRFGDAKRIDSDITGLTSVHRGDVDGDGNVDLVAGSGVCYVDSRVNGGACQYRGNLVWYANTDGLGTFSEQNQIPYDSEIIQAVSVADVDSDNDLDLLFSSTRKTAWFENMDGRGTFEFREQFWRDNANALFVADVDRDGDMDVISGRWGNISWHENVDGKGNFEFRSEIVSSADGGEAVHVADLDNDGDVDLVAAFWDGQVSAYENTDGKGSFRLMSSVDMNSIGSVNSLYTADLDLDGDVDILTATGSDDRITWHANADGQGRKFVPQQAIARRGAPRARSAHSADLDGDGDFDVLSASEGDDTIAWYENLDSNGTFGPQRLITAGENGAYSVYAFDLDGDGDHDVLTGSRDGDTIVWHENTDGRGTFDRRQVISSTADWVTSVFAEDMDGDGDADVLSASLGDDTIAWHENLDGQGSYGPRRVITDVADGARDVHAADLDQDGDLDVISAGFGNLGERIGDSITWYENVNGQGTFGPPQTISTDLFMASSTHATDVDGDGDLDVLYSAGVGLFSPIGEIGWYENQDGQGTFGAKQRIIYMETGGAASVYSLDVDGDQDVDVIAAMGDRIVWTENLDGRGTFGRSQFISDQAKGSSSVFASDFDGDGDLDVLSTSSDNGRVSWHEQHRRVLGDATQDGRFDADDLVQVLASARYLTGEPASFEEGDWNGDGLFDQFDIVNALQRGGYLP